MQSNINAKAWRGGATTKGARRSEPQGRGMDGRGIGEGHCPSQVFIPLPSIPLPFARFRGSRSRVRRSALPDDFRRKERCHGIALQRRRAAKQNWIKAEDPVRRKAQRESIDSLWCAWFNFRRTTCREPLPHFTSLCVSAPLRLCVELLLQLYGAKTRRAGVSK